MLWVLQVILKPFESSASFNPSSAGTTDLTHLASFSRLSQQEPVSHGPYAILTHQRTDRFQAISGQSRHRHGEVLGLKQALVSCVSCDLLCSGQSGITLPAASLFHLHFTLAHEKRLTEMQQLQAGLAQEGFVMFCVPPRVCLSLVG